MTKKEEDSKKEAPIHWTASILILVLAIISLFLLGIICSVGVLAAGFLPMQAYDRHKYGKKKFPKMTVEDYGKTIG